MKDPGFVPYDAIFFTDQDQVPANRYFVELSHISHFKICSCDNAAKSKTIGSQLELQQIQSIIPSPMSQNMLKGSDVYFE